MKTVEQRFWKKVNKDGPTHPYNPELGNCWQWIAGTSANGYGLFECDSGHKAHRFSWILHNGEIPNGLWVLHSCDNRRCVNPTHLFLGTRMDNIKDMVKKGRHHNSVKTHCKLGHELNDKNTFLYKRSNGHTERRCLKCQVFHNKRYLNKTRNTN